MGKALTTDLYEINMAASYLRREMTEPATFSLFVRRLPPTRGFLVAAGLEECLQFLSTFRFEDDELAFLEQSGFRRDSIEALAALRFTGDVLAVPEGRVVLANEPLLEVTAPLPEAQIVESYLLNQVTYATTLATKAARCAMAAGPIELFDFALRRTHGTEAALALAAPQRDRGLRRYEQRRGGASFRSRRGGNDGALLRSGILDRERGISRFRRRLP